VLDPNGEFMVRTQRYLEQHPDASFEEVEAACFPGEDGKLQLFAISPRHLEACATRTCQVLVEGEYSGVLRAGEHYIEVKRDLSNVEEVLDLVEADSERARITEAAYRDVVASGRYTYRRLVESIETEAGLAGATAREPLTRGLRFRHRLAALADRLSWVKVAIYVRGARALRWIGMRVLPKRFTDRVRDRYSGADAVPPTEQGATGENPAVGG